jgi:Hemerythrin HHE cation binding domain
MADEVRDELSATLKRYHREIDHLLDLIDQLSPGDSRREDLLEKLFVEVMRHQVAEVTFVDPLLRMRLNDGDEIAATELTQHEHLEATLRSLERVEDGTEAFDAALRDLREFLDEHARHQEQQVLPQLRATIDSSDLDDVAARMLPTQQAGATMSHPSQPGHGTLSTDRRVGLTDRVRDAFLVTEGVRVIGGSEQEQS